MAVRTRQTYMDLCRSDRPWRGREMEDLVDKIYDVEDKVERRSKEQQKAMTAAGASFNPDGEGYLQKREGKWVFGEPDFLTKPVADVLYAPKNHTHRYKPHAPFHHWNGGDALSGQQIAELRKIDRPTWAAVRLDPDAPAPTTRRTGDMFWDTDNHCPSFVLEGSDTIWQGPMEDLLYGQNDSEIAHGNGLVGYISGSQGQRPTIDISRADDRAKSLAVVFAIETEIAQNNSGYYTSRGFVRNVNTNGMAQGARLWLQPTGGYGTAKPSVGANVRNVTLGHVVRSHATTGSLFADITPYPFIDELSGVSIVSPTTGQVLAFNGTIWENTTTVSAAKLNTPRSIGMTGDGTWSVSFDGSANVSGAMTLASIIAARGPVGSATKAPQFTWDSKGRLTAVDEVAITPAWSSITSKPTTFSGLGVTMLASDIPNHASRHHWDGSDPISGQSLSGLRSTNTPSFYGISLGDGGVNLGGVSGVSKNAYGEVVIRPSSGAVMLFVGASSTACSNSFSAASGQFMNLSTGFVRSNSVGQLSSSSLLASELPNHASRHHWDGADPLTGQSINGLRIVNSPRFLNLNLDGALNFSGYSITTYDGDAFYVETSGGWQLIKSTLAGGTIITSGLFPTANGLECGKDGYRWNFRSNDTNHDVEIINATEGAAGSNIASIPSVGNCFRLSAPTDGGYKNFRTPDNVPGIGKELVLTCTSIDPNGFIRVYAPSSGYLMSNGASVAYIDFSWGRKLVLHSDGNRWYV